MHTEKIFFQIFVFIWILYLFFYSQNSFFFFHLNFFFENTCFGHHSMRFNGIGECCVVCLSVLQFINAAASMCPFDIKYFQMCHGLSLIRAAWSWLAPPERVLWLTSGSDTFESALYRMCKLHTIHIDAHLLTATCKIQCCKKI